MPTPEPRSSVVVVHGLWMTGLEATLFRQRLAREGFRAEQFHYRTTSARVDDVLAELRTRIESLPGPVHLVGHSLGGLVVLRLAERCRDLALGNVVLLGSPVNGSRAARAFMRLPGAAFAFGDIADHELVQPHVRRWQRETPIGVIAGNSPVGLGRLFAGFDADNDGTVSVDETRLEGATEHLLMPVSHMGMLLSEQVCTQVVRFLHGGRFEREPAFSDSARAS